MRSQAIRSSCPRRIGGEAGAANALYAIGQLKAIGFSPFGIEDEEHVLANVYSTLSRLSPLILEKQTTNDIAAVVIQGDEQRSSRVTLGEYTFTIAHADGAENSPSPVAVLFLRVSSDEYIVAGSGRASVSFSPATAGLPQAGIVSIDEEVFTGDNWVLRRRLNGDESAQGQLLRLPGPNEVAPAIFHVKLYRYRSRAVCLTIRVHATPCVVRVVSATEAREGSTQTIPARRTRLITTSASTRR